MPRAPCQALLDGEVAHHPNAGPRISWSTQMVKILFCLRRLPTLSAQEFQKYWYEVHAPLIKKHQQVLRIARYVQFHSDLGEITRKLTAFRDCLNHSMASRRFGT